MNKSLIMNDEYISGGRFRQSLIREGGFAAGQLEYEHETHLTDSLSDIDGLI